METTTTTSLRILLAVASKYSRLFSSSAPLIRQPFNNLYNDSNSESSIYKRPLELQPPSTVMYKYNEIPHNSVNLIGMIDRPFTEINTTNGSFGVHTHLRVVKQSTANYAHFWVTLKLWYDIAEMSVEHFKPNDFVCVSGYLQSYMKKAYEDGILMHNQEVVVKEINFVAEEGLNPSLQKFVKLGPKASAEEIKQMQRNRLHLWQIFFWNPYEWWDNRKTKNKANSPDFRHKDTGEVLYLKENDPPWIKQQLALQDLRMSRDNRSEHKQHLSYFEYDG